jgi:hypothetical protein
VRVFRQPMRAAFGTLQRKKRSRLQLKMQQLLQALSPSGERLSGCVASLLFILSEFRSMEKYSVRTLDPSELYIKSKKKKTVFAPLEPK